MIEMMTNGRAYPPGRAAARRVYDYLIRESGQASATSANGVASIASPDIVEAVIDAAFWASLRREEGYSPRLSLAILPPQDAVQPLIFESPLPVTPGSLVRVSPAVVRPGLHIAVSRVGGELRVWGTVRSIPIWCCVVEVVAPGLLVIKHRPRDESRKFVNIVALEGDLVKIIDQSDSASTDCPSVVSSLFGSQPTPQKDSVDVLVELAVSMRAHGRGGTLLLVPSNANLWKESIVHPVPYAVTPTFAQLGDLMRETDAGRRPYWERDFDEAVFMIAGLTAADGATVMNDAYELHAFGAKIARRDGHARVEQVTVTEPIEGMVPITLHPTELGGTRHLSAAQFVQDQRGALALVASQDGRFTVFSWSPRDSMVNAHRVEVLLL